MSSSRRRPGQTARVSRLEWRPVGAQQRPDTLAVEEPLELRLQAAGKRQSLAVTMRTPGHDFELAAGFLLGEGIVGNRSQIRRVAYCTNRSEPQNYNLVQVELHGAWPDLSSVGRNFTLNSSCGVCGKAGLEQLELAGLQPLKASWQVAPELLASLATKLKPAQPMFNTTGGLHAAALLDREGQLLAVREDVGRHNALDKLLGWALLQNLLPLDHHLLLLSGRISYELVLKALRGGIGLVGAMGAPSSLAVELAQQFGLTLAGFLRPDRFNVYTHRGRLEGFD